MRVLFITGATHLAHMRNLNHFQRVHFLSQQTSLTVFARKGASFEASAEGRAEVLFSRLPGRLGHIASGLFWLFFGASVDRYDLILSEPSSLAVLARAAKWRLRIPWVVDVWDMPIRCQSRRGMARLRARMTRTIVRWTFRAADLFLVSMIPDYELREYRIPRNKMVLLPNAIWLDEHGRHPRSLAASDVRSADPEIVCMRSRYSEDSGLDLLAEAFTKLREAGIPARLLIVGAIPRELEGQVERLRGRPDVVTEPFMAHDALMDRVANSAACVIPYRDCVDLRQIYPVKVIEYLAAGAVLVVPNLDGIVSITDGERAALVFKPGDANDLERALRVALTDRQCSARLRVHAKERASAFDCRHKAAEVLNHLERIAASMPR